MVETFFTEKGIIKKIIIVLVFIFMFNFTFSYLGNNVVLADEIIEEQKTHRVEEIELEEGGGKLLLPIQTFLLFVTDAIMQLLQDNFYGEAPILLDAKAEELGTAAKIAYSIAFGVLSIGTIVLAFTPWPDEAGTAIAATSIAAKLGITAAAATAKITGGLLITGAAFGAVSAVNFTQGLKEIRGEFKLPNIGYSFTTIFSGSVPLFDINFFNPKNQNRTVTFETTETSVTVETGNKVSDQFKLMKKVNQSSKYYKNGKYDYNLILSDYNKYCVDITEGIYNYIEKIRKANTNNSELSASLDNYYSQCYDQYNALNLISNELVEMTNACTAQNIDYINRIIEQGNTKIKSTFDALNTITSYSFSDKQKQELNKIVGINLYKSEDKEVTEEVSINQESSAYILQKTVASMYKTLRTVAIVALLSILVYVGIRMVISSTSKDKAKYKQMLMDWLVAFIMLFVLHYIMAFIIDICEKVTQVCNNSNIEYIEFAIPDETQIYDDNADEWVTYKDGTWKSNIIGYIRFYAGLVRYEGYTLKGISFTIMYIVMVIYIIIFSFQYMKRVLYMAFLTMIAPLVAITYPLDKISDGKAQGFSMWLREYIFNALLQPIHYVIYVVIMGSVMNLAGEHPVYALVALGFMVPAEKFIRKMFGFEKASTVGAFGGAAGAAMLMSGVQRLTHRPHKKDNDDNGAKGEQDNPNGKIKTINSMPKAQGIGSGNGNEENVGTDNNTTISEPASAIRTTIGRAGQYNSNTSIESNNPTWDSRLTPEQIDYARENDIHEPKGQEYEQFLGQLGYGTKPSAEMTVIEPTPTSTPAITTPTQLQIKGTKQYDKPIGPEPYQKPNLFNRARTGLNKVSNSARTGLSKVRNSSLGQGVKAVGGHYTRRLENKLRKSHPLRSLRRGITYAAGAATLGTIGLAAGIASGDPSKALQYTMAGGIAGGNLGKNLGETASNIVGLEGAAKSFKAGALGEKYNDIEREKYKRNFKRNVSNYDAGVRNVTAKGWREMSKNGGIIDTALDYGINNIDDMSNIYRAQQRFMNKGYNEEEAMKNAFAGYDLDKNFGDYDTNDKTREKLDKLLKANGYTNDEQRKLVKEGVLSTMNDYQAATLGRKGDETEVETQTPPDYVRIANNSQDAETKVETETGSDLDYVRMTNNNQSNEVTEAINTPQDRENNHTTDKEPEEERDDREIQQPPTIPINQVPQENQEEIAKRANAESEANKAQMKQESRNREIEEQLQKTKKQAKKNERRDRAEKSKTKNKEAKAKRNKIKEENNVFDGEQGTSVKEFKTGRNKKSNSSATILDNSEPIKTVDETFIGDTPIQSPPKK